MGNVPVTLSCSNQVYTTSGRSGLTAGIALIEEASTVHSYIPTYLPTYICAYTYIPLSVVESEYTYVGDSDCV